MISHIYVITVKTCNTFTIFKNSLMPQRGLCAVSVQVVQVDNPYVYGMLMMYEIVFIIYDLM